MKKVIIVLFHILILIFFYGCNSIDPPADNYTLNLTLEDVSCTEAWIKVTGSEGSSIILFRNDKEIMRFNIAGEDSTILNDSLLPNQSYNYQIFSSDMRLKSNKIIATTMDTTSHDFNWQSWTFGGEAGSSVLYDVAIINENDIWAVGEIYLKDSLRNNDYVTYNAIHWDGTEWELQRINFYTICGQTNMSSYPARSIFIFNSTEILIAMHGDQLARIKNGVQTEILCLPWSFAINKIWGISKDDFYVVGNNGNIARFLNGSWQKIESATEIDIQDIWGNSDDTTPLILCAASNVAELSEHKILRILNNNNIDSIQWRTDRRIHSLWCKNKNKIFTAGGGVFIGNNSNWREQTELPLVFSGRIRGTEINNVFAVGHLGLLAHFNGVNWKVFSEAITARVYTSLDYKANLMVTVGYTERKAVIQFMRKN